MRELQPSWSDSPTQPFTETIDCDKESKMIASRENLQLRKFRRDSKKKGEEERSKSNVRMYEEREKPRYGVTHWITAQNGRRNSRDEFALLIPKCLLSLTQLALQRRSARVLRLMPLASVSKDHLAVTRDGKGFVTIGKMGEMSI